MMKRSELGVPIKRYSLMELGWKELLRVFLPLLLVVLAPIFYGFWRTLYGYSGFGPAAALKWGRNWFLAGGILAVFFLLYSLYRLVKSHTWIEVYSWGLFFHFPPSRKRILAWEEITGLTIYSVSRSLFRFRPKTRDHILVHSQKYSPLKCNPGIKNLSGLKKTIKKKVYGNLGPKMARLFTSGETLLFGELAVSNRIVYLPSREIGWENINSISVKKGSLIIHLVDGNIINIPIRRIFNLEILIHLIKTEI